MSELKIKQRQRPVDEILADVDAAAGRASVKTPVNKVIKLGAKERLNSYVTPEQKKKLRLLAIEKGCSISEVVGVLIDETPKPEF
ncbi:hypothetical protein [Pseudomonas sp. UMAB-40]|uniref:hypothetical protein n=1 Tax=Pseudomonas sp. UMAB-40 TaxID=1365407 RepID=UPI001C56D702|nr:hypothetical protein [Pseudomonas sp. UMAB-40]